MSIIKTKSTGQIKTNIDSEWSSDISLSSDTSPGEQVKLTKKVNIMIIAIIIVGIFCLVFLVAWIDAINKHYKADATVFRGLCIMLFVLTLLLCLINFFTGKTEKGEKNNTEPPHPITRFEEM